MARNYVRENVPLSRFGVLVAQLESIVASASQKSPDPLLCFDLLSDLLSAIDEEPKESILLWQRKCEDALYSLLILGARRPVRHLASIAMARIISKGDSISIYSRASSLQGFLSDGKRSDPHKIAGATQCLGELYRHFGRRITSGLHETTIIAAKLMKSHEEFVRQEALLMLQNALEGSGGSAVASAYNEAFRLITRFAIGDKSFIVRIAAARCLKAFANIGGPGLGVGELDTLASYCVKALEDPLVSVRDAFAEALGSLVALGMNPDAQVQPRGKGPYPPAKKLEGGLQKHLALPFTKASGIRSKDIRVGITLSWVFFLQAIQLKYLHPDTELQDYALSVIDMLHVDTSVDAHALACVLYILRIGVTDQMMEPTQRSFLVFLGKQLQLPDATPSMKIAALRTLSYTLKTLGEVPHEFKEVFDNTVVATVSHSSKLVRIEAALSLHTLAEVDPTCIGGLISYGVTILNALRENVLFEKGNNLKVELDSLHGQAMVLAALVSISPKLPLGYPARLPRSVLEVSKKMLTEPSRNPVAATVEEEAGWLLLSSLLSSMPNEDLEDQVFDILSLWADLFGGNPEDVIKQSGDLTSKICVLSAAVNALTSFIRCFVSSNAANSGILLQPVILYLSRAVSYISLVTAKELPPNTKLELEIFIIRTLIAYQSLPDPMAYKSDHSRIVQLCTIPYRDASGCEESSCLRFLLDKRDAWLGPWIPGRDWFEDELRAFQGGKDGLLPCVWEDELSSFPQPETVKKTLVNQMLLCFGVIFASQDSGGMLSLLGIIEQCLKAGKKQPWHAANITNICVGLLSGLKALHALRPQPLEQEILNLAQNIFKCILAEGDICASQRRASSEGLGLLARLGNDIFTARMTRMLLGELNGITDSNYAGSIALALGCIHRSAGGMALSTLVPATVSSISLLAKTAIPGLQIWSLHGLLLTIEAAGLSFVSHVQATLGLAIEILLSEENGRVDLQQGVGRLINAIVAVLGPELAPGSIFFSRCKSVVAEISSSQETATLLESVRFTQQLVLFAPQAASVHSHVQTLLLTLSSRQPTLRHLAVSTLRHLIEKDPVSIMDEQIEDNLFHMLDEETDSERGNLVRGTIMRLLYVSCPSHPSRWILICRNMVLAMSTRTNAEFDNNSDNGRHTDSRLNFGDDDNMVSSTRNMPGQGHTFEASSVNRNRDKHLRYRTRVFAAECLSCLPDAVGNNPAHFDLTLARKRTASGHASVDWLVLHVQELISVAYQISTIQFENMRPIGVGLLSSIVDKFETIPDPELPGHLLLEQYQAQLISAVRTALDTSSGPILLEAGLQLATKIMTSGVISGDQAAVKRIFSLISRPLDEIKDLYYPSFAEWVSSRIKIRLLAAHASLKCYTYAFLRRHHDGIPDECLALLPLFSRSSSILGKYWIWLLKDFCYICLHLNLKRNWNSFLDGIQSALVSSKLQPCLEEAWPVILQALALDSVPANVHGNEYSKFSVENMSKNSLISGYSMVELEPEEYRFLWGFALLILFQGQHATPGKQIIPLASAKANHGGDSPTEEIIPSVLKFYEIVLPVFQFLSSEKFFYAGFLPVNICEELLQVFSYSIHMDDSWNSLAISVLSQIVQNCPEDFLETEKFAHLVLELCLGCLLKVFNSTDAISPDESNWEDLLFSLFATAKTVMRRFDLKLQKQLMSVSLAFPLIGYKFIRRASTESSLSKVTDFVKSANSLLKKLVDDAAKLGGDIILSLRTVFYTCLNEIAALTMDCIEGIHLLENKRSSFRKLLQLKLAFSLEQNISLAKLTYETHCIGDDKAGSPVCFSVFKFCTESIHSVLTDSNVQVQAIGFQVLKSLVQRSSTGEDNTFLIFLVGELIRDIFTIMQNILKKQITKESAAIVGECLRLLMLMQTLSKASECQRGFMNLLLVTILMVFSASEDDQSQEINDIRSTAVRLVSHLAEISSSAVHLKDVLLSMSTEHRQQLQGVIRASVTQDHSAPQVKATSMPLEIKLPVPTEGRRENTNLTPAIQIRPKEETEEKDLPSSDIPTNSNDDHMDENEEDEDEDDWDTFQSFPASGNTAESDSKVQDVAEDAGIDENFPAKKIDTNDLQGSSSQPLNNVEENTDTKHPEPEMDKEEIFDVSGERNEMEQPDFQSNNCFTEPCVHQNQKGGEGVVPSIESKDGPHLQIVEAANISSVETQDHERRVDSTEASTKVEPSDDAEASVKVSIVEHYEHSKENPDNTVEHDDSEASVEVNTMEHDRSQKENLDNKADFHQLSDPQHPEELSDSASKDEADSKIEGDEDAGKEMVMENETNEQDKENHDKLEVSKPEDDSAK